MKKHSPPPLSFSAITIASGEYSPAKAQEFGKTLKSLRENSSRDLDGLAQATRISKEFIVALEEGRFADLPGKVFGRGFVRNLCRLLNGSSDDLLASYDYAWQREVVADAPLPVASPLPEPLVVEQESSGSGIKQFSLPKRNHVLLAVLVLGVTALVFREREKSPESSPARIAPSEDQAPLPQPQADAVLPPPVGTESQLKINQLPTAVSKIDEANVAAPATSDAQSLKLVVKERVSIRLGLDGGSMETLDLKPDTYDYQFKDQAQLLIFDASALDVVFNGNSLGALGSKGRIRRLSFAAAEPAESKKTSL